MYYIKIAKFGNSNECMLHFLLMIKESRQLKRASIMLPFSVKNSHDSHLSPIWSTPHRVDNDHTAPRKRRGKGCYLLPLVKRTGKIQIKRTISF